MKDGRKSKTGGVLPCYREEDGFLARTRLQAFNAALRFASLLSKLVLTLYMARYLSLSDMGVYGLVFGTVMVLTAVMGQRLDYIVTREIVGAGKLEALSKMRDQAVLYLANCFVLGLGVFVLASADVTNVGSKNLVYIVLLASLEGFAAVISGNMNSLNRQVMANVHLFIRSGLWVVPVVVLGLADPAYRTVETVLQWWTAGVVLSYALVAWEWRDMPWREALKKPVDWPWLWNGLKSAAPMWIGSIGLFGGGYVDRFVVLRFLTLDDVGIITFYTSFTGAMLSLLQSGVAAFACPRLILHHREGQRDRFHREFVRAAAQIAFSAAVMAIGLAVAVPLLARVLDHPVYAENAVVLWLMLAGTWLRANADTLYIVLFARHQDRPLWLGNILFLAAVVGCNALFVAKAGLPGIGYGTIASALFLLLWRMRYVFFPESRRL